MGILSSNRDDSSDCRGNDLLFVLTNFFGVTTIVLFFGSIIFFLLMRRKYSKIIQENEAHRSHLLEFDDEEETLKDIIIEKKIGGGHFGDVFKGIWAQSVPVALKRLKRVEDFEAFYDEIKTLKSLNHPNTLRYLGTFTSPKREYFIVTEFIPLGSLDNFISKEKETIQIGDLIAMAFQAAAGMKYVEQRRIVHRDLALRNLLISCETVGGEEKYVIKIADFGMSKQIKYDYYKSSDFVVAIKWSAPEAVLSHKFSHHSDSWSFGVVLWELFSFGMIPYPLMSNKEAFRKVRDGYRMPSPDGCPDAIYELMLNCWKKKPTDRPNFQDIFATIHQLITSPTQKESNYGYSKSFRVSMTSEGEYVET